MRSKEGKQVKITASGRERKERSSLQPEIPAEDLIVKLSWRIKSLSDKHHWGMDFNQSEAAARIIAYHKLAGHPLPQRDAAEEIGVPLTTYQRTWLPRLKSVGDSY